MLILVALLLGSSKIPATMDPAAIPGYQVLGKDLAVAGQPTAEAFGRLKKQGFRTVIDLSGRGQGLSNEKDLVKGLGLEYVRFPISPRYFDRTDAFVVGQLIDLPWVRPVLLHGASADGAGAVWAVLQAKAGKSQEEALQEGRKAGLTSEEMIVAVRRVLENPGGIGLLGEIAADYDQPPRMLKNVRPQYPDEAFSKKIEGIVELEILIGVTGRVEHVRLVKSIPLLDLAAIQCVYQWEFSPAVKAGKPVASRANAPVSFRIFARK